MKNKCKIITFIMLISTLLVSCTSKGTPHTLLVSGDIDTWMNINEVWDELEKEKFEFEGEKQQGVGLKSLLDYCGAEDDYDVYLKTVDGLMIEIIGDTIENTYLAYSAEFGFCYFSNKHPVSNMVKFIDEIIVKRNYGEYEIPEIGMHIITQSGDMHKSIGELSVNSYETRAYEDDASSLDEIPISEIKRRKVIMLSSIVEEEIECVLVMDAEGRHEYIYADEFYIEIDYNKINLFTDDKNEYYKDIEGVIINPPAVSVMNAYYDSKHYLGNDEKVMLIFVDGLSYMQYEYICENNPHLFLSNIEGVQKATTVFKPVTNAGFAAMITGAPPIENGILNRDYREVRADTIFDFTDDINKTSLLIEGEVKILNTESDIILNIDSNSDGYTDDEVYLSAMQNLNAGYGFILAHFHGIDDAGHDFGPFADETLNRIEVIDEYINDLVSMWDGKVIIVSDHGMHETLDGGDHGEFRSEDMFIPYAIISGGKYEK